MRSLQIPRSSIPTSSKSLEHYLSDLSKIPLITAEEEIQLAKRIRKGDARALDQLVRANLRFVVSIAKQYQHNLLPLMDLISEGNIGLIEAAQGFDETKGFKFISYAVWWIRKAMLQAISKRGRMIRLPDERSKLVRDARRCFSALEQQLERKPTLEEMAEAMELEVSIVQEALLLYSRPISVHAALDSEEDSCYLDVLEHSEALMPDEGLLKEHSIPIRLEQLLATLKTREQLILILYFGLEGKSDHPLSMEHASNEPIFYEEIGKQLGLGADRVRQLKHRALKKLRVASLLPCS